MKAYTQISNKLKDEGRTKAWLASQLGLTRSMVSKILLGHVPLSKDRLRQINKALKTRFKDAA